MVGSDDDDNADEDEDDKTADAVDDDDFFFVFSSLLPKSLLVPLLRVRSKRCCERERERSAEPFRGGNPKRCLGAGCRG